MEESKNGKRKTFTEKITDTMKRISSVSPVSPMQSTSSTSDAMKSLPTTTTTTTTTLNENNEINHLDDVSLKGKEENEKDICLENPPSSVSSIAKTEEMSTSDQISNSNSNSNSNDNSAEEKGIRKVEEKINIEGGGKEMMNSKLQTTKKEFKTSGDPYLEALINRQIKHCPLILKELLKYGKKTSHWAWWIFPTEKEGLSEPSPSTKINKITAYELLNRAPIEWQKVLELIVKLSQKHKNGLKGILPPIDLPRVHYFVLFWSSLSDIPVWMKNVLKGLKVKK